MAWLTNYTKNFTFSYTCKFTCLGVLFGFMFPLLAYIIDFSRLGLAFTYDNFLLVHTISPLHYIIETAPFILGCMAFFTGKFLDEIKDKNVQITKALSYKDDFLASMSHEIRTPMTGILGVVDLLKEELKLKGKQNEHVDIIKKSANDLMRIIDDILDLSKIQSGKFVIEKKPVDLQDLCVNIKNLYLAIAKSKQVDLILDFSEETPKYVMMDAVRLKQILTNLVGNALKFTEMGHVTMRVTTLKSTAENAQIKFEVIDTGIGIANDKLLDLFTPYSQIKYTSKKIKGTGLGLAICKKLVELMNGNIGVESQPDFGSNFWFDLPVEVLPEKESGTATTIAREDDIQPLDLHLLVVDDNLIICKVYAKLLKKLGCQVVIAKNGKEALHLFKEGLYDAILMDINMPEMDGWEAMESLRTNYENVPPIICASASALQGDIDRYMSGGFDDYITKPFTLIQLYTKLFKWKELISAKNKNTQTIKI